MSDDVEPVDVLVVGAGVSGLACAREVVAAGGRPVVLDRARGVGGRCATHRLEGQPVDIGVLFLHGTDPRFLALLREVPAERREGWPSEVNGAGRPCQPGSLDAGVARLAFVDGMTTLPRHLARGLDVRRETDVERLDLSRGRPRVHTVAGATMEARDVVLALAPEQALRLLDTVDEPPPGVASARALLSMSRSEPCLAMAAVYRPGTPPPPWHVCFPADSAILQAMSHDSSKREGPAMLAMVYQARPRWSRERMDEPGWPEEMLAEAARCLGPWAATPQHAHPHRWRYARSDSSAELAGPMVIPLPGGGRLTLCGDRFAPGGGVEAAWRSGTEAGRRIMGAEAR